MQMFGSQFTSKPQHGLTNAVVLPSVLQFNREVMSAKIPIMSEAMGLKKNDFDYFYKSICELLDQFKIPKKLSDIKVKDSSVKSLAKKALKDSAFATNPKTATFEEMIELIGTSINYGR